MLDKPRDAAADCQQRVLMVRFANHLDRSVARQRDGEAGADPAAVALPPCRRMRFAELVEQRPNTSAPVAAETEPAASLTVDVQ